MRSSLFLLAAAAAAAPVAACTTTESDSVLTKGMSATISATGSGAGQTTVSATLYLGQPSGLSFINLEGGDQLIAHHEGQSKAMSESNFLNIVSYAATFPTDAADATFEVDFQRAVDAGAPSTLVALPPPFTLGAVPASASRAAAFGVNWTGPGLASGDRMLWRAEGSCIELASGTITGDPGSVTMPAGTFKKQAGQNVPDSCQVTVTVSRERDGDLDPGYGKGGTALGIQARTVTFTSMP